MDKVLLGILVSLCMNSALAECPTPEKWGEDFYTKNRNFHNTDPSRLEGFLTQSFFKLLQNEAKYSSNHTEVGALNYDPWLGAQDGETGKPISFKVESQADDVTIVSMSFPFIINAKQPPIRTVHFILHSDSKSCWRLQDFITPLGDSLSYVYSGIRP